MFDVLPIAPDAMLPIGMFLVANVAGFVDSIAGGGGLLTMPALLWAGLPPAHALATNKLQACFGSGSASVHFIRTGTVHPGRFLPAILGTFIGSALGAGSVQILDQGVLRSIIPILLVGAALFFLFMPNPGTARSTIHVGEKGFALFIAPALGFYDGFFGPGTGSFMVLSLVVLSGWPLTEATARTKILNFSSNIAAFLVFLSGGEIQWQIGLIMAAGQMLGAQLGSRLVIAKGAVIVRPLLVLMSLAITARIVFAD